MGIFTVLFRDWPIEKVLKYVSELGCEMIELGAGGVVPTSHLPDGKVDSILEGKADDLKQTVREHGLGYEK